eukprot:4188633-Amphidinium_carterae.1
MTEEVGAIPVFADGDDIEVVGDALQAAAASTDPPQAAAGSADPLEAPPPKENQENLGSCSENVVP